MSWVWYEVFEIPGDRRHTFKTVSIESKYHTDFCLWSEPEKVALECARDFEELHKTGWPISLALMTNGDCGPCFTVYKDDDGELIAEEYEE